MAGPISSLLCTTKEACDVLSPLVRRLYVLNSNQNLAAKQKVKSLKADLSVFTIADGIVQELLKKHLFRNGKGFENIVGEEDTSVINIMKRPYTVDSLQVPKEFFEEIDVVRQKIEGLSENIEFELHKETYQSLTVFIDPIDGTREFAEGKGEQCTILVGCCRSGVPVGGLIYRPVPAVATWAAGCKEEKYVAGDLDKEKKIITTSTPTADDGLITTNGSISAFTEALINKLGSVRVKAGGVGNKAMNILEGKAESYIQDRGVSRWDTAGPQAVLEAYGGCLSKLLSIITTGSLDSYTYRKTQSGDTNPDLEGVTYPDRRFQPNFCAHNALTKIPSNLLGQPVMKDQVQFVKPYSNVCGLFALSSRNNIDKYERVLKQVIKEHPPKFT